MKKLLSLLIVIAFAIPVFATCQITMPCSVSLNQDKPVLKQQTTTKNIRKTDTLQNTYSNNKSFIHNENHNYNANCQFGICLPGKNHKIKNPYNK